MASPLPPPPPPFLFFLPLSQQCRWGEGEETRPERPQVPLPRPLASPALWRPAPLALFSAQVTKCPLPPPRPPSPKGLSVEELAGGRGLGATPPGPQSPVVPRQWPPCCLRRPSSKRLLLSPQLTETLMTSDPLISAFHLTHFVLITIL